MNRNRIKADTDDVCNVLSITEPQKELQRKFIDCMFVKGYQYVGLGIGNRTIPVKYIDEHVDDVNQYFTPNIIAAKKDRNQNNVEYLNALYFDLDIMHDNNLSTDSSSIRYAYYDLIEECKYKMSFKFTAVVNTGHGLQCYIKFKSPVKATDSNKRKWISMQKTIGDMLVDYSLDNSRLMDCASLLRLPCTVNDKSKKGFKPCRGSILELNPENTYTFEDLYLGLCGEEEATDKQLALISDMEDMLGYKFPDEYKSSMKNARKTIMKHMNLFKKLKRLEESKPVSTKQYDFATKIAEILKLELPEFKDSKEAHAWISEHKDEYFQKVSEFKSSHKTYSRGKKNLADYEPRNAEAIARFILNHPENSYRRENAFFLLRLALMWTYDDEDLAWNKIVELNNTLNEPFDEDKLRKATYSAVIYYHNEPDRHYGPNAIEAKICEPGSGISILPYFACAKRVQRDRSEYQKQYYDRKLEKQGKLSKEKKIANRRARVVHLREEGYSIKQISSELQVSVRTVAGDISVLKKDAIISTHNLLKKEAMPPCKVGEARSEIENPGKVEGNVMKVNREVTYSEVETAKERIAIKLAKVNYAHIDEFGLFMNLITENEQCKTKKPGVISSSIVYLSWKQTRTIKKLADYVLDMAYEKPETDMFEGYYASAIRQVYKCNINRFYGKQATRTEAQKEASSNNYRLKRFLDWIRDASRDNDYVAIVKSAYRYFWNQARYYSLDSFSYREQSFSAEELLVRLKAVTYKEIYHVADILCNKNCPAEDFRYCYGDIVRCLIKCSAEA